MSEAVEAIEGAIALILGGFIFLSVASTLDMPMFLDFDFWGLVYITVGGFLLVTVVAVLIGGVISR